MSFHLQCVARASNAPSPSGRIKVERVTCSHSNPVIRLLWPWPQCKHTPVPSPPVQITPKPHYHQSLTEMMSTPNGSASGPLHYTALPSLWDLTAKIKHTQKWVREYQQKVYFLNGIMTSEQQLFMVIFLQSKIQWVFLKSSQVTEFYKMKYM